jgi:tricorn protease
MEQGYYQFPTISGDTIVFVCEGDLWSVPVGGGVARRLTANPGPASTPALSPDGALLAFAGRDEGEPEVYVMPAAGGSARRLTFLGADVRVSGWSLDGSSIIFSSNAAQPFAALYHLYAVDPAGGPPRLLPSGPARSGSFGPEGAVVIGRHTVELAYWKRYRGGRAGALWVDSEGDGDWRPLIQLPGNMALPHWVGERVYFLSDHQGVGNLYSCRPSGDDLRRHTHHVEFYARQLSGDGRRLVYQSGADIYVFDPAADRVERVAIEFYSPRAQRKRKFVDATRYRQGVDLHPAGHSVALTVRGRPFSMGAWDGPALQHGDEGSLRYSGTCWLADGKRLAVVADSGDGEVIELHHADGSAPPDRLDGLDIGRPVTLAPAPQGDLLALTNHRFELLLVDLAARSVRALDRSQYERIHGLDWSPDGRWIAYSVSTSHSTAEIRLCEVASGQITPATAPVLRDYAPAFDPDGKYLYFLSDREFTPVRDALHFEWGFPQGGRPYLLTLRADLPSPFVPPPTPAGAPEPKPSTEGAPATPAPDASEEPPLRIDLEGIARRVVAFPVPPGRYRQIRGIKGKALFLSYPVEAELGGEPLGRRKIEAYDFAERSSETLIEGAHWFEISRDGKQLIYRADERLRILKAGEKPKDDGAPPGRKSGWLDLARARVSVDPAAEWAQMYREAWRLQREHFWTADMSGVDWQAVYQRYLPLLDRVATRAEFNDLLYEMQGELGTSHAYVIGGDQPRPPSYDQGFLGADLRYDLEADSYLIERVVEGDIWNVRASSPLARPGVNVRPGDRLLAVNGRPVGRGRSPAELLVNQANQEVLLTIGGADGAAARTVAVRALGGEWAARYRDWVESNRRRVHEATDGRIGYLHIPDMGARGLAEFQRGYLAECGRDGLVVDVRYNGGGNVSQLILKQLARRPLGYDIQRWGAPEPYPVETLRGPIVALTNENAGSDGDIFSHAFKLLGLGPLIGKRTWGGVIGISPRTALIDGGQTTQPEYSFWFNDVGWQVENYGTDPDIEIDIRPQDYLEGRDPQLERAIAEALARLAELPDPPAFGGRPRLAPPALPEV